MYNKIHRDWAPFCVGHSVRVDVTIFHFKTKTHNSIGTKCASGKQSEHFRGNKFVYVTVNHTLDFAFFLI